MRLTLVLISIVVFSDCMRAQELNIIPQPVSVKQPRVAAKFNISPATQIVLEGSNLQHSANFFNDYLQRFYLFKLKVVNKANSNNAIILNYERMDNAVAGAYQMTVNNKGVYIAGDNEAGVFYGMQTLIQLLPVPDARLKMRPNKLAIPYVSIEDEPRFGYRGMMLDVGRHFFPVSYVKKYIDYLALHKFNKFHWHLTDDQGWRIEIKKYPKLTSVGGWRNGTIIGRYPGNGNDNQRYGGFYTQEEIKEVVKYAAARYIDVIPEIEMPGHACAAIAAYPELSCFPDEPTIKYFPKNSTWAGDSTGKQVMQSWGVYDDVFVPSENTFKFLEDVLDEVMALFPYNYIHIGGDECPKTNWKRSAFCQQLIKEKGLKDEHGLQSYFIQRMEKYINSKGKKIIGWDEILEGGLAPNATVMSWRGEAGGIAAAKQKHEVIMTPTTYVYFDYSQTLNEDSVTIGGYLDLEKVYNYEPLPKELSEAESKYISGAQANLWTEYVKYPAKVEYMIFPRMTALCEVIWSPKGKRSLIDFEKRLQAQFKRYDLWRTSYSRSYFGLKSEILPTENYQGVIWSLSSKCKDCKINLQHKYSSEYLPMDSLATAISKTEVFYSRPVRFESFSEESITAHLVDKKNNRPDTISSLSIKLHFNIATGKKITLTTEPIKNYPGNGAFTLVNGIQNEKGLARGREVLGWSGDDLEAVIDLGNNETISNAIIHSLFTGGSRVYPPQYAEIFISADGQNFTSAGKNENFEKISTSNGVIKVSFTPVSARYIKVLVKNLGKIPAGRPGEGEKPLMFVDEIEVN
jgi:hexosaminidase